VRPNSLTSCAVLLLACLHTGAQAQSGYVMTTLKPPTLGKSGGQALLDSQNRATGTAGYLAGPDLFAFFFTKAVQGSYTDYVSRWSASTSSSLTPSKLYSQTTRLLGMSPDGNNVVVSAVPSAMIYNVGSAKAVTLPPLDGASAATCTNVYFYTYAVNDAGAAASSCAVAQEAGAAPNAPARTRAVRWLPGKPGQILPLGAEFISSGGGYINAKGMVAGTVTERDTGLDRVALWAADGTLTTWANEPNIRTYPMGMDDAGRVLVYRFRDGDIFSTFGITDNGTIRPITPSSPDVTSLNVQGISPTGVVVGMSISSTRGGRAFAWRDGVFTDLTDLLRSKGVSMPASAYLSNVWSMNAQGSFVGNYIASATASTATTVRFIAKP
jgi:probable HAF family extracellular repeat protein